MVPDIWPWHQFLYKAFAESLSLIILTHVLSPCSFPLRKNDHLFWEWIATCHWISWAIFNSLRQWQKKKSDINDWEVQVVFTIKWTKVFYDNRKWFDHLYSYTGSRLPCMLFSNSEIRTEKKESMRKRNWNWEQQWSPQGRSLYKLLMVILVKILHDAFSIVLPRKTDIPSMSNVRNIQPPNSSFVPRIHLGLKENTVPDETETVSVRAGKKSNLLTRSLTIYEFLSFLGPLVCM